ncbi:MAG: tetratricopeptide repeat protein [Dyella sp.]
MILLGAAGCTTLPVADRPTPTQSQPLQHATVVTTDAQHDLLAQLLVGDMALGRTDLKAASRSYANAMAVSDDPKVAEQAALLSIAVHDDQAAAAAIDRWQVLGGTPAQLAQARAQLALSQGKTALAQQQLERLVDSGDADAWRQFGRVLLSARDAAQAAQLLQAIATPQRLPADAQAWLAMSELSLKLGRTAYAQQLADAALKRFQSADTYAWAAQMKYRAGDLAGGHALFEQGLAKDPKNLRLRLAYASVLGQTGDFAAASKLLDSGVQSADTFALRAALAARTNDKSAMRRIYAQLQQSPPPVQQASYFLLGQLAETLDRNDEALNWYDQVGDDDAHAFDADLRSAVILQGQGKSDQAHEILNQLQGDYLNEPPQLRRVYEVDAELYMRDGNFSQAEAAYGRALQVVPDDPALLYGRGLAYAENGKIDPAIADFRRLLELKPGDVDASNALGFTLVDANRDLPEAEQLITHARAARPNDASIADSWGWLQFRLGHLDQAEQVLRAAWQAAKDADVGVHLGEVLWQQGRKDEARKIFDQVRREEPKNASLSEALRRLGA